MTIGSSRPGRRIVTVQPPGALPLPPMPPACAASNAHVGGALHPSPATLGGAGACDGGLRLPAVPDGGSGTRCPQRRGTTGSGPPVNQGSFCSCPYQFTSSSDHAKPCTGQLPYEPLTWNGTRW